MDDTKDALANVVRFCDTYEAMSGRTDELQGLHVGTAREVILLISDLRALAAENAALQARAKELESWYGAMRQGIRSFAEKVEQLGDEITYSGSKRARSLAKMAYDMASAYAVFDVNGKGKS